MATTQDFTPAGNKVEGQYENDRNAEGSGTFKAIIREAYGVTDVICGHHLVYESREKRADGFTYEVIQEVPSADALIFDHDVARKIWGKDFKHALIRLALEPIATRDALLAKLYAGRITVHDFNGNVGPALAPEADDAAATEAAGGHGQDWGMETPATTLAGYLRSAEAAHAVYEKGLGHRDENWSEWYARFIVKQSAAQ